MNSTFASFISASASKLATLALATMTSLVALPATAQVGALPLHTVADKPRNIEWLDLVPKDWNPMQAFEGMDLNNLQDNDPQAAKLMERMRTVWDQAPTRPQLEGAVVRIPGFIVPLENHSDGLKEFLLVPYFGACIHTPPPPANQIIHVKLSTPLKGFSSMDAVWVVGKLGLARNRSDMGVSGYQMQGTHVSIFTEKKP